MAKNSLVNALCNTNQETTNDKRIDVLFKADGTVFKCKDCGMNVSTHCIGDHSGCPNDFKEAKASIKT